MSLSLFDCTLLLFSSIAAGPAGIEPAIAAGGLATTLLGLIVVQTLFGVPQSLIVLGLVQDTGGGHNGGVVYWSEKLIGRHAMKTMSLIQMIANCATAAAVAQISDAYLSSLFTQHDEYQRNKVVINYSVTVGCTLFAFLVCSISLRTVIRSCAFFSLFTLVAFALLFGYSVPSLSMSRLRPPRIAGVKWAPLLNTLVFNASGYDSIAVLGDEIKPDVKKRMYIVIIAVMFLTSLTYILTLGSSYLASSDPDDSWKPAHFAIVARNLGGPNLRIVIVAASIGSMIQMFTSSFEMALTVLKSGFKQSRQRSLTTTLLVALAFCFIPVEISLGVQSILYGTAYIAEVYLYTLLEREASVFLYFFLAISLLFAVGIILLQDWVVATLTLGTVAAYALVEIVFDTT